MNVLTVQPVAKLRKKRVRHLQRDKAEKLGLKLKELVWAGYWDTSDGYGYSNNLICLELLKRGYNIEPKWHENCNSINMSKYKAIRDLKSNNILNPQIVFAYLMGIDINVLVDPDIRVLIAYSMWEATEIPPSWVAFFNHADRLLVPSTFCRESFYNSGVTNTEIDVVNLPVNTEIFTYHKRKFSKPFKFLFISTPVKRKGIDVLIKAFMNIFKGNNDVRLHLHTRTWVANPNPILDEMLKLSMHDNRISWSFDAKDDREISIMLKNHHCLIQPSRGEGFGMVPAQALSTGMPVIATGAHAHLDFLSDENAFLISIKGKEDCNHPFYREGQWFIPSQESLEIQMQEVYSKYHYALCKAKQGSIFIQNFSVEHVADKIEDIIKEY